MPSLSARLGVSQDSVRSPRIEERQDASALTSNNGPGRLADASAARAFGDVMPAARAPFGAPTGPADDSATSVREPQVRAPQAARPQATDVRRDGSSNAPGDRNRERSPRREQPVIRDLARNDQTGRSQEQVSGTQLANRWGRNRPSHPDDDRSSSFAREPPPHVRDRQELPALSRGPTSASRERAPSPPRVTMARAAMVHPDRAARLGVGSPAAPAQRSRDPSPRRAPPVPAAPPVRRDVDVRAPLREDRPPSGRSAAPEPSRAVPIQPRDRGQGPAVAGRDDLYRPSYDDAPKQSARSEPVPIRNPALNKASEPRTFPTDRRSTPSASSFDRDRPPHEDRRPLPPTNFGRGAGRPGVRNGVGPLPRDNGWGSMPVREQRGDDRRVLSAPNGFGSRQQGGNRGR